MSIIWFIIGFVFCIYGIYVRGASAGTNFFLVWIFIGITFFTISFLTKISFWNKIPIFLKRVFWILFAIGFSFFLFVEILICNGFVTKEPEGLDYIIVLGAQVYENGPSIVLEYRLEKALAYLNDNPNTLCIVTGGQGYNEPFSEAEGMSAYLIEHGIEESRIILEDKATNTIENITNSMKLYDYQNSPTGIVTNEFHIYRSVSIAQKQGIENVYGVPAHSAWSYLPSNMFREFFGILKDVLKRNM